MKRAIGVAMCVGLAARPASGQVQSRVDLVRCAPASDVPCLRTHDLAGRQLMFIARADGSAGLARVARRSVETVHRSDSTAMLLVANWRPPLVALPAFRGVADSAALTPTMRDLLIVGAAASSNRPAIAALVSVVLGLMWMLVVRLGAHDGDPVAHAGRENADTGAETTDAASAEPRSPDDVTKQTARRTALGR